MEFKEYNDQYEDDLIKLWNEELKVDPITLPFLRNKFIFDENFDPKYTYIAIDNGHLIGICYGVKRKFPYLERGLEKDKAWISFIIVQAKYQRKGIGTALLKHVENELISDGAKDLIVAYYSPSYFFSGVDTISYKGACQFFLKNGYERSEIRYAMRKDLKDFHLDKEMIEKENKIKKLGYRFTPFDYKYSLELLDFVSKEFGAGWKRNCLSAMQKNTAEDVLLLVVDQDNHIVGFSCRAIDGDETRFGPFGIKKDLRNLGIGSAFLQFIFSELKKKGLTSIHFLSTEENGKRLYSRYGFTVEKINQGFIKKV